MTLFPMHITNNININGLSFLVIAALNNKFFIKK